MWCCSLVVPVFPTTVACCVSMVKTQRWFGGGRGVGMVMFGCGGGGVVVATDLRRGWWWRL
ncbi:hypothetical protein A2U01_0060176 [Trifolium medium]|uniref:Secreted protein n=1 Tax=Trifolium medium TaxID=97028 RepID=A0A392RRZ8_9FABA|nr:hypothetical protein [Trifolium medium]